MIETLVCLLPRSAKKLKNILKRNIIPVILIIAGLIAAIFPLTARIKAEEENKYYDIIVDYGSMREMVRQSSHDMDYWMELFADLGINKIGLFELTAENLQKDSLIPVHASTVKKICVEAGWESDYPETVVNWLKETDNTGDALISADLDVYEWILEKYEERGEGFDCLTHTENGKGYIFITGYPGGFCGEDWLKVSLGMWPEYVDFIEGHGMTVVPRTSAPEEMNFMSYAESFYKVLEESGSPYFMGGGSALPGENEKEKSVELLNEVMANTDVTIAVVEEYDHSNNIISEGLEQVIRDTNGDVVRVFNVWPFIQNRYEYYGYEGAEEITNALFRSIVERSCKVVYLKMILEPKNDVKTGADEDEWIYVTDPDDYVQFIGDLNDRLGNLGYELDDVPPYEFDSVPFLFKIIMGFGVVGAAAMLLDMLWPLSKKWRYGLLIVCCVCVLGGGLVLPGLYKSVLSILGGVMLPAVSAVGLTRHLSEKQDKNMSFGRLLGYTVIAAVIASLVAFCGSIMATSALSELEYMIELELYRGVKMMQLIPIAIFGFTYLLIFAYEKSGAKDVVISRLSGENKREKIKTLWKELMDRDVKLGWLVFIIGVCVCVVVIAGAGVYYIYRTGNYMQISGSELQFRNKLEILLIARPRTKEFLIGWPFLMLFVWSMRRKVKYLPLIFGLAMSVGLVSIVNTFVHIHTRFYFSILRTMWGAVFGIIIGIVFVIVAEVIYNIVTGKRGKKNV